MFATKLCDVDSRQKLRDAECACICRTVSHNNHTSVRLDGLALAFMFLVPLNRPLNPRVGGGRRETECPLHTV